MRKAYLFKGLILLAVYLLISAGSAFAEAPIIKLTAVEFVHGDKPMIQVSVKNLSVSQAVMAKVQGIFPKEGIYEPDISVSRSFKLMPNSAKETSLPLLLDPQHKELRLQVVDLTVVFDERVYKPEEYNAQ